MYAKIKNIMEGETQLNAVTQKVDLSILKAGLLTTLG
jgi:hypothetical protein